MMIITDQFVYIHMPKTGGTFVSTVLHRIHEARGDAIVQRRAGEKPPPRPFLARLRRSPPMLLTLLSRDEWTTWNPHGTIQQLPHEHRHKPVLTTIRSPYDRYVSQYEFKWWRQQANPSIAERVKAVYPHYPDISFEEFVYISNQFFPPYVTTGLSSDEALGRQTIQFLHFFYSDPAHITTIDRAYLRDQRYRQHLHPTLRFTFTHNLNRGVYEFLLEMGYAQDEIAFILDEQKILPKRGGRSAAQQWEKYYTPALKAWVRQRERVLFDLFPDFDV